MNLIERLGGYEAAKKIAENTPPKEIHQTEFFDEHGNYYANDCGDLIIWGGHGWLGVEGNCPTLHCIDYLIHILLQYRHQHNIFEVGDKVVFDAHFCDEHKGSGYGEITYCTMDKRVFEIDNYYLVSIAEIQHATDAEIKAGKRLGVNDGN